MRSSSQQPILGEFMLIIHALSSPKIFLVIDNPLRVRKSPTKTSYTDMLLINSNALSNFKDLLVSYSQ